MKQIKRMSNLLLAGMLFSFIAIGCAIYPVSTPPATPSTISTVETLSLSTVTPKPTTTPVPSPTSLPTSTVGPTAIPTVPSEEILNSLRTNGGCLLPCWWSILPGETTIEMVRSFTERFGNSVVHVLLDDIGNFDIRVPDGNIQPKIDVVYGPLQGDMVEWLRVSPILYYQLDSCILSK